MKRQPLRRYVPPALMCWSLACKPAEPLHSNPGSIGGPEDTRIPDIVVDPPELDFGVLNPVLEPAEEGEISVCNVGEADLTIQSVALDQQHEALELLSISTVLVPPGGCASLILRFDPLPGEWVEDWVHIESDDPDRPVAVVHVQGEGGPTPARTVPWRGAPRGLTVLSPP